MCGRYGVALTADELSELFEGAEVPEGYLPRYNIAPTQEALVARGSATGARLDWARWGLIPPGEDSRRAGARHINARSETAASRWPFRNALAHRRCLVPASGFYEWRRGPGGKVPYWIHGARPLTFAGIWERPPEGLPPSFAILTRAAPPELAHIHDRVPVLVPEPLRSVWLDKNTSSSELEAVVQGASARLEAHPVSVRVNRVEEDSPDLIRVVDEPLELPLE
ncbi:MAG: SOS response-associated peptidase [Gemmatimonadota bacterium]